MRLLLVIFLLLFSSSCNQPRPVQTECVRYRTCASCVSAYCGYCGNGCFSFQDPGVCPSPIGFVQDCTDGTAPFPDPVVNPIPYRLKRDGGAPSDARRDGP